MEHDEDLLEQLYWEFDQQRKVSGDERLVFKNKLRFYANTQQNRMNTLKDEPETQQ